VRCCGGLAQERLAMRFGISLSGQTRLVAVVDNALKELAAENSFHDNYVLLSSLRPHSLQRL